MDIDSSVPAHYAAKSHGYCNCGPVKEDMPARIGSTDISIKSEIALKGKSSAPGQIAMSLKAEIAATGADMSFNIQGKLASGIAKGADSQSLFFAFAVSFDSGAVKEPSGELPVEEPPAIEAEVEEPEETGPDLEQLLTEQQNDYGLQSARIALEILTGVQAETPNDSVDIFADAA